MNFTFPRHFDRNEWRNYFDKLMNHQGLDSNIRLLQEARDYAVDEYLACKKDDVLFFKTEYEKHLLSQ